MLEAAIIIGILIVVAILYWPRPDPYDQGDIASTRNGQPWWRDREPY